MNASSGSGLWPTRISCLAWWQSRQILGDSWCRPQLNCSTKARRLFERRNRRGTRQSSHRADHCERLTAARVTNSAPGRTNPVCAKSGGIGGVGADAASRRGWLRPQLLAGQLPGFALEVEQLQARVERRRVVVKLGDRQLAEEEGVLALEPLEASVVPSRWHAANELFERCRSCGAAAGLHSTCWTASSQSCAPAGRSEAPSSSMSCSSGCEAVTTRESR